MAGPQVLEVRRWIGPAPARLVFVDRPELAGSKGTVLFFHGLHASKDAQDKELASLAARGWLAVGIDVVGHGERRDAEWVRRLTAPSEDFEESFFEAVRLTAAEIPGIIDELVRWGCTDPHRVAVSGISMGGYITYAAAGIDPRIKVLAPILGSPRWKRSFPDSPHKSPERFFPVALLAQTAGQDQSVPPRFAREFHQVLEPFYASAPERLAYVEFAGCGHFMPEPAWDRLWANLLAWLETYLG